MKSFACLLCIVIPLISFAQVEIIDRSTDAGYVDTTSQMSLEQRVDRLEQQMNFFQQLNLPSKIVEFQEATKQIHGTLETVDHRLIQLERQQQSSYSDLNKRLQSLSSQGVVQSAMPSKTSSETIVPATTSQETSDYQAAFTLIKNKQYTNAIGSFKNYLKKYPSGQYAANVHYWLGELYAISGQNNEAINEFKTVVSGYADSAKAPDAMLALGVADYNLSQWDQAKQWWQKIISQYPTSSAARIAKTRLVQLQREGH